MVTNPIDLNILVSDSTLCKGDSTLLVASLVGASKLSEYSIVWSPSGTLFNVSKDSVFAIPSVETVYTLLVTDTITGCTYTDSLKIEVGGDAFSLVMSNDTSLCSVTGVNIGVTDGAGPGATYNWTPLSSLSDPTISNPLATPSSTTTYFVEVTSTNGCSKTDSVKILVTDLIDLNISITDDTIHLCNGGDTLLIANSFPNVYYTWTEILGNTNLNAGPVINDSTWRVTTAGLYVFQIDSGACSVVSDTITVEFHTNPNPIIVGDTTVCSTLTMEKYTLLGIPIGTKFSWGVTGATEVGATNLDNIDIDFSTTDAELTIEERVILPNDAGVCIGQDTMVITISPLPNATLSSEDICFGDSSFVSLNFVSGRANYAVEFNVNGVPITIIDSISTDTTIGFKPTTAGVLNYSFISITDANGCSFTPTSTASINIIAPPNIGLLPIPSLCLEDSDIDIMNHITNGVASGYTFAPSILVDGLNMFSPKNAGLGSHDISIEYIDPINGCVDSLGIEIIVKEINASFPVLEDYCYGDGVFTLDTLSGLFPLYLDPKYDIVFSAPVGLDSDGITFDPTFVGAPTYNTTIVISMTVTEVPVSGENACTAYDSTTLYVSGPPTVSFTPLADHCTNDGLLIITGGSHDGVFTGGTYSGNGVTYNTINDTYEFDPLSPLVTKGAGSPNVINYEYKVGLNCKDDSTVNIIINDTTIVTLTLDPICEGETPVYNDPVGFIGGVWSTTNVDSSKSGIYDVTYNYTNASICSSLNEVTITVNSLPAVNFDVLGDLCESSSVIDLGSSSLITVTPPPSSGKGGIFSGVGVTDPDFDVSIAGKGIHTLKYTYTDDNDCVNESKAKIIVKEELPIPDPVLNIIDNCEGSLITVTLGNYEDYNEPVITWSGAQGVVSDKISYESLTFKNGDLVKVEIKDVTCKATTPVITGTVEKEIPITIYTKPVLVALSNVVICEGTSKSITVLETTGTNVTYTWSPTIITGATIDVSDAGIYNVTASNAAFEDCSETISFEVSVVIPEVIASVSNYYVKEGGMVELTASHLNSSVSYGKYTWEKTNDLTFLGTGTSIDYISTAEDLLIESFTVVVEVIGLDNCEAIDTISISKAQSLSAPYLFSPNEDGINDLWIIENLNTYDNAEVLIYNRWGMEVRYLNGEKEEYSWDGKNRKGVALPDGVYYYIITGSRSGESVNLTGYVTIVH